MNTDLDHAIKSAVADIVAAAPDVTDDPTQITITTTPAGSPRRLLPAAAAVIIIAAGVTGIALASRGSENGSAPAASELPVGAPLTDPLSEQTEPPSRSSPVTPAALDSGCSDGSGQATVPNVAGMVYPAAVDALLTTGLSFDVARELPPEGAIATDDEYAVVGQDIRPGDVVACGAVVRVTAAYRPGILYTIRPGDTWESVAISQGIPVEDLLAFSGFSVAELEADGKTIATPLEVGRAISLSLPQPTLDTIPTTTG